MKQVDCTKRENLARRIQEHPALQAAREHALTEGDRMDLIRLLMQYFRFEETLQKSMSDVQNPADLAQEQELLYKKKDCFDGVAFMEAFEKAIQNYDPAKGAFLACFTFLYKQEKSKKQDEQYRIVQRRSFSMGEKKACNLKKLLTLLGQTGQYRPENLPRSLYGPFSRVMKMSEEDFAELLKLAIQEQMEANDAQPDDEDGEPAWMDRAEDMASMQELMTPERLDNLCVLLDLLTDLDQREYPRLFLTNELLRILKEQEMEERERVLYAQAMIRRESQLWERVFIQTYLDFVYDPSICPDCIRNLILGHLIRKLQHSTIAEYKHVSQSTVSQSAKRFWRAFQSEKAQRIQELLN